MNTKELNNLLKYEAQNYIPNVSLIAKIIYLFESKPQYVIYKWQSYSRKSDYYKQFTGSNNFIKILIYHYYTRKRNILGRKLGLEIETSNIGKGLLIYHYNNVINGYAHIGENLHLHGDNCIGNSGIKSNEAPTIGNNVMLGVGAKVIGNIELADNIKVAAGAVVIHSFLEQGITIAGIPAKKVK